MANLTPEELMQAVDLLGEKVYGIIHQEVSTMITDLEAKLVPLYTLRDKVAPSHQSDPLTSPPTENVNSDTLATPDQTAQ